MLTEGSKVKGRGLLVKLKKTEQNVPVFNVCFIFLMASARKTSQNEENIPNLYLKSKHQCLFIICGGGYTNSKFRSVN